MLIFFYRLVIVPYPSRIPLVLFSYGHERKLFGHSFAEGV